jgi:hypothetical protein
MKSRILRRPSRQRPSKRLLGGSIAILLAVPLTSWAQAKPPVAQDQLTAGGEIEGLIWVSPVVNSTTKKPYPLYEKAEYIGNASLSYGLPYVTLELDQVDRANGAGVATAEIVTAPFATTVAGLTTLLETIHDLCVAKVTGRMEFKTSADFGPFKSDGSPISSFVRAGTWCGGAPGAPQLNVAVPASKLLGTAAAAAWPVLTKNPAPATLGVAADAIAGDLIAVGAPLAGQPRDRVGLWVLGWLSRLTAIAGKMNGRLGYYKDTYGATIKMYIDPIAVGLPESARAAMAAIALGDAPKPTDALYESLFAKAKTAVDSTGGVAEGLWADRQGLFDILVPDVSAPVSVATERPLATRLVGTGAAAVVAPIVESRANDTPLNEAFKAAYGAAIKNKASAAAEARKLYALMAPLR